eukprot:6874906-Pyramimonas_sp.AAC.1
MAVFLAVVPTRSTPLHDLDDIAHYYRCSRFDWICERRLGELMPPFPESFLACFFGPDDRTAAKCCYGRRIYVWSQLSPSAVLFWQCVSADTRPNASHRAPPQACC